MHTYNGPVTITVHEFLSSNSFAKMARNHALFLNQQGYDVYLEERAQSKGASVVTDTQRGELQQLFEKGTTIPPSALRISYDIPDRMCRCPDEIHFVTIETASVPRTWIDGINKSRHVCTISQQNRNLLIGAGARQDKITAVQLGYDPKLYSPDKKPLFDKNGSFVFLFLSHFAPRKGIDLLLHAYYREFHSSEKVLLRLVTQPMFNRVAIDTVVTSIRQQYSDTAPTDCIVHRFNTGFTEEMLGSVYTSCDCLAIPTKGEAFGLPFLEAKACGIEVIATRCSGQLDFLNDANAHLIEVESVGPDESCTMFNPGYRGLSFWKASIESLRRQMRAVFEGARKPGGIEGWTWEERTPALAAVIDRYGS